MDETPHTSPRAIIRYVHKTQPTVWRILNEESLHLFLMQIVAMQNRLQSARFASVYPLLVEFCRWFRQLEFLTYVLFTDEKHTVFYTGRCFQCAQYSCVGNRKSTCYTSTCIPEMLLCVCSDGIVNDFLIGPYLLPIWFNGSLSYLSGRGFTRIVAGRIYCRNQTWF